jgi:hypothetical protein
MIGLTFSLGPQPPCLVNQPYPAHLLTKLLPKHAAAVSPHQRQPPGHPPGRVQAAQETKTKVQHCYNKAKFIARILGHSPKSIAASLNHKSWRSETTTPSTFSAPPLGIPAILKKYYSFRITICLKLLPSEAMAPLRPPGPPRSTSFPTGQMPHWPGPLLDPRAPIPASPCHPNTIKHSSS